MHILTMHICWLYNLLYLPFSLGALMEDPWGSPLWSSQCLLCNFAEYHLILLSHFLQILIRLFV